VIAYKFAYPVFACLLLATLLLVACGDENSTANPEKDLPKDRLMYLSNADGWPDLYTVEPGSKVSGRLTESAEAEFGATWSPDGTRIIFTELNGDQAAGDYNRTHQLVSVDADGKNRKVVNADGFNPQWSPDSARVLFTRTVPDPDSPTATPSPTPSTSTRFLRPSVPLPILAEVKQKSALYIIPADGSVSGKDAGILLADRALYGVWSPDGKRLAYISGNNLIDQPRSLYLTNADGSNRVNLSDKLKLNGLDVLFVSWSPDGSSLAFTAADSQRDKVSLYKASPEGTTFRRLTDYAGSGSEFYSLVWAYADYYSPSPRLKVAPVWSFNSRYITFADASPRITISEVDTGNSRTFPVGSAAIGQDKDAVLSVSWLPDNRRIVFERAGAGRNALVTQANNYIFDWFDENLEVLDTANKSIAALGANYSFIGASCCGADALGVGSTLATPTTRPISVPTINDLKPSGKLVLLGGVGTQYLSVVDLETGQRIVISSGAFRGLDASVAPAGGRLAYLEVGDQYTGTLWISSLDGKQRVKLSEGVGAPDDLTQSVRWSPDGKRVAYQALGNDPRLAAGLYVLSLEQSGAETPVPSLITNESVSAFDWSNDGRTLAYKLDKAQYELYLSQVDTSQPNNRLVTKVGAVNSNYSALGKGLLWSPDGKTIAITGSSAYSRFTTWLVSPEGQVKEITGGSVINRLNAFSPDSARLVATTANYSQNNDLQALNLATGSWRVYGPGSGAQLDVTGQYVAVYSRYDITRNGATSPPYSQRMTVIQLSNGQQYDLELNYPPYYAFRSRFFDWSPSQPILAFYQNNTIWGSAPDLKKPQPLARAIGVERVFWVR